MKRGYRHIKTRLAVIGAGIAGFAASIFALEKAIPVVQLGHTGAIAYTTGYLDLFGVSEAGIIDDPWAGLEQLRRTEPEHPLSRLANEDILTAFEIFTTVLSKMGIGYTVPGSENLHGLLPAGLIKPTLSVPATMLSGIKAMRRNEKTLIIDFEGLAGFSALEFKANFAGKWDQISTHKMSFPGLPSGQAYAETMARAIEVADTRQQLAEKIIQAVNGEKYVGLPAMLGMHEPDEVHADLERLTGLEIFEIPTIPPAVPGIRLREMFERVLPARGLVLEPQLKVKHVDFADQKVHLFLSGPLEDLEVEAETVILATGRFLSGGLNAGRNGLDENLLDLHVSQPPTRNDWYRLDYMDRRGHAINRAGIETDIDMRPLDVNGRPYSDRLFAAGAILAHQDWVRQRCGAGLAIATAYQAVEAAGRFLHG